MHSEPRIRGPRRVVGANRCGHPPHIEQDGPAWSDEPRVDRDGRCGFRPTAARVLIVQAYNFQSRAFGGR